MITIKTQEEIEIMAEGGKILAGALKELAQIAKPGITTLELDRFAEKYILDSGAEPAFKNYEGFPKSLCVSVNEEIVHGIPSNYVLKDGDILKLDLGVLYKGYNTDSAITLGIGKISFEAQRLIKITKKALHLAIKKAKPGNTFGDIGNEIEKFITKQNFGLVRDLVGHGIGKKVHEEPSIPNFGKKGEGPEIKEGMVFCIEPMVTTGSWKIKKSKNSYGYSTIDNSLSAHFEHTIAITQTGPKILTEI
jgi:methionyl aminopeptidase